MRKPDFFIVGAPKCGTTAIQYYLGQHPDIFLPDKEMDFFGSDQQFTR
ncbi:MAG: sulfotransferase, partial [Nitrososphaera sp.]